MAKYEKISFTESQIVKPLKEHDTGRYAKDISQEIGISTATFYNRSSCYCGMEVNEL